MNTNKKGFTLIELLVVIVIIGILATISVATFGGYFKKARDSERQSAVQNIATIMKVLNATEETIDYSVANRGALDTKLQAQGYSTPDGKNDYCYYYGFLTADNSDFFVATGSEETAANKFVAGTPNGITIANADAHINANTTASTAAADNCNTLEGGTTGTYTVRSWLIH